jgi:Excalibur calcium-binding domain
MNRIIVLIIVSAIGWYGYGQYKTASKAHSQIDQPSEPKFDFPTQPKSESLLLTPKQESTGSSSFRCDGRTHCSQMTSCAEATYFLKNCPDTKMDGNNDGVPCETQWCK